jgi:hypothetical protein
LGTHSATIRSVKISEQKLNRLTDALAIAEEFSGWVRLNESGRIVVVLHERWLKEFELRLRQIHWRFIHISPRIGSFRILALVDSWR